VPEVFPEFSERPARERTTRRKRKGRSGPLALLARVSSGAWPGRILGVLSDHPQRAFAGFVFGSVALAISANALVFQTMRHPAPFFQDRAVALNRLVSGAGNLSTGSSATTLPPVRPVAPLSEVALLPPAPSSVISPASKPAPRRDSIGDWLAAPDSASTTGSNKGSSDRIVVESAKIPLNAQRALVRLGYGPLTPDGRVGPETKRAIERFERDHRLPVTGELNPRVLRELTVQTGGLQTQPAL
jgi:hypothetical protein